MVFSQYVYENRIEVIDEQNLKTLDCLKTSGYLIYLLTSRSHKECAHLLHPLSGKIDGIYHTDNIKYPKPDPRALMKY